VVGLVAREDGADVLVCLACERMLAKKEQPSKSRLEVYR
jgi:hypothetical protein